MATATKVLIGIGDEVIELTGADLEAFNADRKAIVDSQARIEAEAQAKAAARESALAKLADLGLTAEEIAAL
jgi:hypothetical protein